MHRNALQVSKEQISRLKDYELSALMEALLLAQAYRAGSPRSEIRVNTEEKAKDGGCDGWSAKPERDDEWLGAADTCWQFKAGRAGEPSRLKGEVLKSIPRETLEQGGRFVLAASGSTNGPQGERDRLEVLVEEAKANGIPHEHIEVLGSERLTIWCNQHPAIAARWAGRPSGLQTFSDWARNDEHQAEWQAPEGVDATFESMRAELDFTSGKPKHIHIHGLPGVGKTRFALELCRGAGWVGEVVYIRQAEDARLAALIDSVAKDPDVRLVVVADEVQSDQLRPLRDSVGVGNGRIRLITIGLCKTPDPTRIPAYTVQPLDERPAGQVVRGLHPGMPREHVDFVVRFADGFMRLVKLAADAVAGNPMMNVHGLLGSDGIVSLLDKMLGDEAERDALYVVAALDRVGWTGDKDAEGKAITEHLHLDWPDVCRKVERLHKRFGIAPRGGRYRYISPTPLGNYLAVAAWEALPDLMASLPAALPTEEAREAYYGRLKSIASAPQVRGFARQELARFFRLSDFPDDSAAKRLSALSAADPELAARNLHQALQNASLEEREAFKAARSQIVWTLVELAWRPACFYDAAMALALLAEAENESWSNNATGEFLARYQVILGGTAVPYLERLEVLDELVDMGRPALLRFVIQALTRVSEMRQFARMGSSPASDEAPAEEWKPRTWAEHFDCILAAVGRLVALARRATPEIQEAFVVAARELAILLRDSPVRQGVEEFFNAVREAYPESREAFRRAIADIVHNERSFWKELPAEELAELEALHARFEDASLPAQLRQHVGTQDWERDAQPDLAPLAASLLASPETLQREWPWLTSGEASDGWRLGEALARADAAKRLTEVLPVLLGAGPDLRVLCGYIHVCRQELGDGWYDRWLDAQWQRTPRPIPLLFETVTRCGGTARTARLIVEALQTEDVAPAVVGQLAYGRWSQETGLEELEEVLRAMMASGHEVTAVKLLAYRFRTAPNEKERWRPLALELAKTPSLIRSRQMASYHWKQITLPLVKEHAGEIVAAICREQDDRSSEPWFAEHSDAEKVLRAGVEADPLAVWEAMLPWLSSRSKAYRFSIGFPRGVVDQAPMETVLEWVSDNPEERAPMLADLANKDYSRDETLASQVLGAYGDIDSVSRAFNLAYVSGSWAGPASAHWEQKASELDAVATRTALPKLRRWAQGVARNLRAMAEDERKQEAEEDLRYR